MSKTKISTPPPAPTGVNAGQSMLDYQRQFSNPELQALTFGLEQQYRPQYAALNLADIGQYQQGGINLLGQGTRQLGDFEREALALQRASDVSAISQFGPGVTEATRQADPYAAAIADQQNKLAMKLYGQSQGLTPEQLRLAQQSARSGSMARGRIGDQSRTRPEKSARTCSTVRVDTRLPGCTITDRPSRAMTCSSPFSYSGPISRAPCTSSYL